MSTPQRVSITGMGVVSPAGLGILALWQACLDMTPLTDLGLGRVTSDLALATPRLTENIPTHKRALLMALHALTQALDQAGWDHFTADDALIFGTTTGQIGLWEEDFRALAGGAAPEASKLHAFSKQPLQSLADDLKSALGFPGKITILSSACSASTQAMALGLGVLQSGRAKRVIVGGVEELGELTVSGFGCLKLLSKSPCRPFDQDRGGINLSEGAAFYTLELGPSQKALAELCAGQTVLDSYHMTSPNPEGKGLHKAMLASLAEAGLRAQDIAYVHAHGTGSAHNDSAEGHALAALFTHAPEVVSTKGVHGHALGASGALELALCLQTLATGIIPAVTGLVQVDPAIQLNLPRDTVKKKIPFMLKTTLGFGGINSTLILRNPHA